jgi:hypothetical protein
MSITFHWSQDGQSKSVNLDDMLTYINKQMYTHDKQNLPNLCTNGPYRTLCAEIGRKYVRLVVSTPGSRSAYCFIDMKGNILKAASWKAPAKHSRGSVFDTNYSWGKALGSYGAAYLR